MSTTIHVPTVVPPFDFIPTKDMNWSPSSAGSDGTSATSSMVESLLDPTPIDSASRSDVDCGEDVAIISCESRSDTKDIDDEPSYQSEEAELLEDDEEEEESGDSSENIAAEEAEDEIEDEEDEEELNEGEDDETEDDEDGTSLADSQMDTSTGSDWSDDEYEDLMAEMPIALGRAGPPTRSFVPSCAAIAATEPPQDSLPLPLPGAGAQESAEGLTMLQNIRAELEKVGRMIVAKKDGEKFLERAHILASINWLSTGIPACVLDYLGQAVRGSLEEDRKEEVTFTQRSLEPVTTVHVLDSDSDASDLSDAYMVDGSESVGSDQDLAAFNGLDGLIADPLLSPARGMEMRSHLSSRRSSMSSLGQISEHSAATSSPLKIFRRLSSSGGASSSHSVFPGKRGVTRIASFMSLGSSRATSIEHAGPKLPSSTYFTCALLFVDISGFTRLSTLLDPEHLSKVINAYFDVIVNKISDYGGDIQKFAGDAIFAEWRASPSMSLEQCTCYATACASALVKECADFPVATHGGLIHNSDRGRTNVSSLNVHCGIGAGEMVGVHVGDNAHRREYVYLGDPIEQATRACNQASLGEVVVSPQAQVLLVALCPVTSDAVDERELFIVASRNITRIDLSAFSSRVARNAKSRGVTEHIDGLQKDALLEYRRLLSLYAHPVVVSNDVAAFNNFKSSGSTRNADERQREEAELRTVFTMFVNPLISLTISGRPEKDFHLIDTLNSIMAIATRELVHYSGHLRQVIMDDKGLVLIATFGLRGSTFPNMVPERALPAAIAIQRALRVELAVDSRIGATLGDVYCGAIGGNKRNEYAVLGPSVNLAARLMCSTENPGILVDNAVRRLASGSYVFRARTPVYAKGYAEPVAIFEPLVATERTWGEIELHFVGRNEELSAIQRYTQQMMLEDGIAPRILLISSRSGMGKSSLLFQVVDQLERRFVQHERQVVFAKHVGAESQSQSPLSAIKPLLQQVLSAVCRQLGADSMNKAFTAIASSLGTPNLIVEYARRTMLEGNHFRPRTCALGKNPSTMALVSLVSQIFLKCVAETGMTLIAIDDIDQVDVLSWQVLQRLFECSSNVFILGTAGVTARLLLDEDFWNSLNQTYFDSGRFIKIELTSLREDDIIELIMKYLNLRREDITSELLNEVLVQSGGMPRFAIKILEGIKGRQKQQNLEGRNAEVDDAVADIILHRVDSFDVCLRSTLNVGAVLGESFTLAEILSVLKKNKDASEGDLRQQTIQALHTAVVEGILYAGDRSGSEIDFENDETSFTFYRSIWRSTLLRLMLESRKRDVHRKIAQAIELSFDHEIRSIEKDIKAFSHWMCAGDTSNATKAAIRAARELEGEANYRINCTLCEQALGMWEWRTDGDEDFPAEVFELINANDLANILSLLVARGRIKWLQSEYRESTKSYESAIRFMELAKAASQLDDRSIIFPAFVGLSHAIAQGYLQQDVHCRYEKAMLRRFLQETHIHGRLIHHIHALYMQMELYGRLGETDKAIVVHKILKDLYKPERHSRTLLKVYGQDSGALSFSLCSFCQILQGDQKHALRNTRHILKNLIPCIDGDFPQIFAMIYRIIFVLKETGYNIEAQGFYEKLVDYPFGEYEGKGKPFHVLRAASALKFLLALSGRGPTRREIIEEATNWALVAKNVLFEAETNFDLGRLGRCGDSISAEICALLAATIVGDQETRTRLIQQGNLLISRAIMFNRKNGMKMALSVAHSVQRKLRLLKGNHQRFEM